MIHRQSVQTKAILTLLLFTFAATSLAQQPKKTAPQPKQAPAALVPKASPSPAGTARVVILSDLHLDPFQDPTKFAKLQAAPASAWRAILSAPDGPQRGPAFAALSHACPQRASDSPYTLVDSALKAASAQTPHPAFVLVAGDLVVHNFDCHLRNLLPHGDEAAYSDFAAKTAAFVALEVHRAFPQTPVYVTGGNNDSGCADYREDAESTYLKTLAESFAAGTKDEHGAVNKSLTANGSYSVALPKPIERGRLIVLQDIFQAATFKGCDGKPNPATVQGQIDWLRSELESAKTHNEQVWVMAHIPPSVDVYNTIAKKRDVCGNDKPVLFLGSDKLAETLEAYAPEIRLAVFAHTHMDEMHVLTGEGGTVATKLVPSISPVNGNYPAFTVGDIDSKTAELRDYRVVASDSQTGVGAHWTEEYRFSSAYHRKAYTAAEIAPMLAAMRADRESTSPETNAYENYFMVNGGLRALAIRLVWPQYACSLENDTAAGFKACVCAATPATK